MNCLFCFTVLALIHAGTAVLDKDLNAGCVEDQDCSIAYSSCNVDSKKCTCIKGFSPDNSGLCKPSGQACPTWEGSSNSVPGKQCEWHFNQTLGKEIHTCDETNEICYIYPKVQTNSGYLHYVGHCCPKPPKTVKSLNLVCPLLGTESSGSCPDLSNVPADMGVTGSLIRTCSYTTHECVHISRGKGVCCPLPCAGSSSHFGIDGKCYDTVNIGDSCTFTAQCSGGSTCRPSGNGSTCQCKGKIADEPSRHCDDS